jgi:hypothetical protein
MRSIFRHQPRACFQSDAAIANAATNATTVRSGDQCRSVYDILNPEGV